MKKIFVLALILGVLVSFLNLSHAEEKTRQRILVVREAKQHRITTVAVEAYLISDVLEVVVGARIHAQKPKILDVVLRGPGLGRRVHYKAKETLYATTQEEDPYSITKLDGMIAFGKRTKTKKPKGRLTRELFKLQIPTDRVVSGKRYQIWVDIESMEKAGMGERFKFDIEDLAGLIAQQN